jgi:hypothetical protein
MKKIFTLLTVLGLSVMGLNAQQVWTGATSSAWNDPTNWNNTINPILPTSTSRVTIPGVGVPNMPTLSANTTVGSLTLDAGATLNLANQQLTVTGRVAGLGNLIGSPTSRLVAGGSSAVIYDVAADHLAAIATTPAPFFENFSTIGNPDFPYSTIEFGDPNGFDISASTSSDLSEPIIVSQQTPVNPLYPTDYLTTSNTLVNGDNLILDFVQPIASNLKVTAFSGTFFFTDPGTSIINGGRQFNLRITFDDNTEFVSLHTLPLTGAPIFLGFVTEKPMLRIAMEPLGNSIFASIGNIRWGTRAPFVFGSINMDQTGTNNNLANLTLGTFSDGTLNLANSLNIVGVVTPVSGTIASNGNLKLLSTTTGTARVGSHTTTGKIDGNVIVERFIPAGRKHQWRFLGFPYSNPLTLSNISGIAFDFAIPNTQAPSTIKYFNPTLDNGIYGSGNSLGNAGYVALPNLSAQITPGLGVATWIYGATGNASQGTLAADLTISSSGLLNESAVASSVQYGAAGWNFVSNPFASTIDWKSAGVTKTNIDPTVYRWNPESVSWSSYNAITDAVTGNGSRYIESGSGFFVKITSDNPSVLSFDQSAKVANAGTTDHLIRNGYKVDISSQRVENSSSTANNAGLRIKASGTGNPIPADIYLELSKSDASFAFDKMYDAIAMGRSSGADIKFVAEADVLAVQFDAPIAAPGTEKRYYPLIVTVPQQGAANIDVAVEGRWNSLNTVSLIDTKENKTIPMVGGKLNYAFRMEELKEEGRFILAINHVAAKGVDNSKEVTVRVLNNPVRSETIQALISHPNAKAKNWSVLSASGSAMSTGQINPSDASVQHELKAGKLNSNGVYYLKVNFENGDSKTVRFVKL